jgi:hypothetical protein
MPKPKPKSASIPTLTSDPIFAAIEAHRRAWSNLNARGPELDEQGNQRALDRLHRQAEKAEAALIGFAPNSIAGASALLTYAADHVSAGNGFGDQYIDPRSGRGTSHRVSWELFLHRNLAAALPNIAASAA